jgi:hypothetical protein
VINIVPSRLLRPVASSDLQFLHSPYAGNLLGTESVVQVLQLLLQVLQAFPLRPVIRIIVEVPKVTTIALFPIC